MKKGAALVFAVLCLALSLSVPAIAQTTGKISLKLSDSSGGEAVPFATVSLTRSGESKVYKYVLSDAEGKASFEGIPAGSYVIKAELLGYREFSKEIRVNGDLALGDVKMDPDTKTLDAASVSAVGNPIVIKKDTIEYSASSFKTTDNDMLEELLKKLPGLEIDEDGSITSNGETVSKIYIDGKTFFLDDPQLASKNIPAKIVDKVKVVKKKSDQAQFTGIDDGNEETVIDLSIQKGMMNGLFGNVLAGAGHDMLSSSDEDEIGNGDARYQSSVFVGKFTDKNQVSVILNANNANNRGFNDMAGGMMRGMRGGGGGMGQGGGGFGNGNGITSSWMGGINGSTNLFSGKMDLQGNYLYNGSRNYLEESSDLTYYNDGDALFNNNQVKSGTSHTNTYGHRFGGRMEHEFSKSTSVIFEPQFRFGNGDYDENSLFSVNKVYKDSGEKVLSNRGFNSNSGNSDSKSASGFLLFRQRIVKPGRTLSFNLNYNFSDNTLDGFNQSQTDNYADDGITLLGITKVNQRFEQDSRAASLRGRLTYTEPLGKGFFVEGNYELGWSRNVSDKDTWDSGVTSDDFINDRAYDRNGETYSDTYSSRIVNRYVNQRIGANLMFQNDKLHAQLGFGANPTDTYNETNGKTYKDNVVNWAPQAMLFYDRDENTNMRLFYFGNSSQPSTSQLMSVPDNTDPMNVSFGNINLKPYFSHSFRAEFRRSNRATYSSLNLSLDGGLVQNPIVNASWYDANQVQYSMPVNGHNSGNIAARLMFNTPIARSNFSVSTFTNARYSKSSSYSAGTGRIDMSGYYDSSTQHFDYDSFFADIPDIDKSDAFILNRNQSLSLSERLRFTYRSDLVELQLGGRTRMTRTWNTFKAGQGSDGLLWNNQLSGSMNWTFNTGTGFVADADYNWYDGYTTQPKPEFVLNAQISQLILHNNVTLAVKAYDILNQSKNVSPSNGSRYDGEILNNTLKRYVIFSVTFRFGTMGGRRGGRMRGPGGPGMRGPGMGGPGGPPPGR